MMIKYLTKKPSYVCCTCSQDFTRKYNANRHNQNIHFGKAEIVRYFEYLIGRGSGKYLPADPLSYRNKKRNKDKAATFVHENDDTIDLYHEKSDPSPMKTLQYAARPRENRIDDKNTKFSNSINIMNTTSNPLYRILNYLFQSADKTAKEFLQKEKIKRNLEDIERMLHDFHPPQHVQILVTELINRKNATTDYSGLNMELENYRSSLVNLYLGYPNRSK